MADLFAVGVTAGVPFTGTGTAWTLNALATGGVITLGADGTSKMVVTTSTATAAMAGAVVRLNPAELNPNGQVTMATSAPAVLPSDQSFCHRFARFPIGPLPAQLGFHCCYDCHHDRNGYCDSGCLYQTRPLWACSLQYIGHGNYGYNQSSNSRH